jgi:hypothetical protein
MLPQRPPVAPERGRVTGRLSAILSLGVLFLTVLAPAAAADDGSPHSENANQNASQSSANAEGGRDNAQPAPESRRTEPDSGDRAATASRNGDGGSQAGDEEPTPRDSRSDAQSDRGSDSGTRAGAGHSAPPETTPAAPPQSRRSGEGRSTPPRGAGNDSAAGGQGNRGFIQLSSDGSEFFPPANEPHLPCQFWVGFYNFRDGTDGASVAFAAQPPSGGPEEPLEGFAPTFVPFTQQNSRGVTLNAAQFYDLEDSLTGLERHAQQGYHIKLTVTTTPDDISADQKHHVFWVDCGEDVEQGPSALAPANLLLDKVTTGDDAPGDDQVFSFRVTCEQQTVTIALSAGDDLWSWNDNSGHDPLEEGAVCSVDEIDAGGADRIVVTFDGTSSAENRGETLDGGDHTFVVENGFGSDIGGVVVTTGPAIEVVKVADVQFAQVGDTIIYTYRITNTGDVTLTEIELDDDRLGELTDSLSTTTLKPGEQVTVTATHVVTDDDLADATVLVNVATVTGESPTGERVTDTAQASVGLAEVLGIVIEDEQPGPDAVIAGPDVPEAPGAAPVAGEAPGQAVAAEQVAAADELPRTGVSSSALVLLALSLLGAGVLAVRAHGPRVRPD